MNKHTYLFIFHGNFLPSGVVVVEVVVDVAVVVEELHLLLLPHIGCPSSEQMHKLSHSSLNFVPGVQINPPPIELDFVVVVAEPQ